MTRVLLSPFITTLWTPVGLAIINIYLGHVKNVNDDDDDDTQGILVERLTSALWPEYLDNRAVVVDLLEQLDVIVKQSARLSCSVSI